MAIYRIKRFGFLETLKGNPKLREQIYNFEKSKPLNETETKNFPLDLKKYLGVLDENDITGNNTTFSTYGHANIQIFGLNSILSGKLPSGIQSMKDLKRIPLLISSVSGNNEYLAAWYPDLKVYRITQESMSWCLISRGINNLFGEKGPQVKLESTSLKDVIKFFQGLFVSY